ncbi:MAG: GNAT family N-acetyltransferase [Muribaculaceae bacterium]|nr:GNAT family N-acetyltransferase [Muribaculaceae bacterium]
MTSGCNQGNMTVGSYTLVDYASMPPTLSRQVWEARNMPQIRCRMVNDPEIPWEDHERFVASLKGRSDAVYYAVLRDGEFIGSVNLHYSPSGEVERGIYLHPGHIGQGHSTSMLRPLYDKLRREGIHAVITRVKTDNLASNLLERRLGAVLCETTAGGYNIYRLDLRRRRVILRADAGKHIGYGHFIRTLALAGYLSEEFDCRYATYAPTEYQMHELKSVCAPLELSGDSREVFDRAFVDALSPDDIVVLDNYYFDTEYQRLIRSRGCALVCVDDVHSRHFVSDVLFTPGPCQPHAFSMEPYTRFYGGMEWSFLRRPFIDGVRPHTVKGRMANVVTAIGGADPFNLTGRMVGLLRDILPHAHVTVIAGDTIALPEGLADGSVDVRVRVSAAEMVDIFNHADVGVFPASTICIEAIAAGLPVVAGHYVDNQHEFYRYLVSAGAVAPAGSFLEPEERLRVSIAAALRSVASLEPPTVDFARRREDIVKIFKSL